MRKARLATTITKAGEVTFESFDAYTRVNDHRWEAEKDFWDGKQDDSDGSYWVYVEVEYDDEDI